MSTVIFYESKTGYTKEYATILERRIGDAKLFHISKINKKIIKESDFIFFGGPLRNNVIKGLNKFLKFYKLMENKNIFVFAVGIEPLSDDKKDNVITANGLDLYHVRLYFLQGGWCIAKLPKLEQKLIKMGLTKELKNNKNPSISEDLVNQRIYQEMNFVRSENLDRMIDVYHRVKLLK